MNGKDRILLNYAKLLGGNGKKPTGTIEILENGNYDVTNYAEANVNVESEYNGLLVIDNNSNDLASSIRKIKSIDFSSKTTLASFFQSYTFLEEIEEIIVDSVSNLKSTFNGCSSLIEVPIFNTSNVTTMTQCFNNCSSLVHLPLFATSGVVITNGFFNTFANCNSLDNNSLNNILQMCINATRYNGTKTLKYIGLSSEQATTCQGLSNYQAFLDAGWTTGY